MVVVLELGLLKLPGMKILCRIPLSLARGPKNYQNKRMTGQIGYTFEFYLFLRFLLKRLKGIDVQWPNVCERRK